MLNRREAFKGFVGAGLGCFLPSLGRTTQKFNLPEKLYQVAQHNEFVQVCYNHRFMEFSGKHMRTKRWDILDRAIMLFEKSNPNLPNNWIFNTRIT